MTDFWQGFSTDDFSTPRVTIGMGSPKKGKLGHFNFSTGESFSELKGVTLLGRTNGYILFGGLGNVPARCASDDGLNPSPRFEKPITPPENGGCVTCFAKEWGSDTRKIEIQTSLGLMHPGDKPICQQSISMVLADQDAMPFILSVKTHNVKVVKQFLFTNLRMKSIAHKTPPYGISFDLSLRPIAGNGNRYEVAVSNWQKLNPEDVALRANLYEMFGRSAQALVAAEHAELDQVNSQLESDLPF
jgi:hypothetical protein